MKTILKMTLVGIAMIAILFFFLVALNKAIVHENASAGPAEYTVVAIIGDHDVKLIDSREIIWTLQVENAHDPAFAIGTTFILTKGR